MTHNMMYGGLPLAPALANWAHCTEACPTITAQWVEDGVVATGVGRNAKQVVRWTGVIKHGEAETRIPDEFLMDEGKARLIAWVEALHEPV